MADSSVFSQVMRLGLFHALECEFMVSVYREYNRNLQYMQLRLSLYIYHKWLAKKRLVFKLSGGQKKNLAMKLSECCFSNLQCIQFQLYHLFNH